MLDASRGDGGTLFVQSGGPRDASQPPVPAQVTLAVEHYGRLYRTLEKNIAVTLKEIAKFEELLSRALETGVNNVHGIQFRTTELRKHRDRAREMAIQAAREKAELLASQLGRRVGPAIRISEYSGGWYSPYNWWGQSYGGNAMSQVSSQSGDASSSSGTIAFGQITVTANVSVSFALQ